MASENVLALRAEVRKARARATRKVARFRRNGVKVEGSKFDVRREAGAESRYNARQLQAYLDQLNGFTNRNTQYYRGQGGAPISGKTVKKLRESITAFDRSRQHLGRAFEGKTARRINNRDVTFAEMNRQGKRTPVNAERGPLDRAPDVDELVGRLRNDDVARKTAKRYARRSKPEGQREDIALARRNLVNMASYAGDSGELAAVVEGMTDNQILAFWSDDFAIESLQNILDSDRGEYKGSGAYGVNENPTDQQEGEYDATLYYIERIKSLVK